MLYIYLDENNYLYGYGGEPTGDIYAEVEYIPEEVSNCMECYQYVDGEYILDTDRLTRLQNALAAEKELRPILAWFSWYDEQCIQYQRCQRLGDEFDKDISELDIQAEEYAARVKYLREIVNTPITIK